MRTIGIVRCKIPMRNSLYPCMLILFSNLRFYILPYYLLFLITMTRVPLELEVSNSYKWFSSYLTENLPFLH